MSTIQKKSKQNKQSALITEQKLILPIREKGIFPIRQTKRHRDPESKHTKHGFPIVLIIYEPEGKWKLVFGENPRTHPEFNKERFRIKAMLVCRLNKLSFVIFTEVPPDRVADLIGDPNNPFIWPSLTRAAIAVHEYPGRPEPKVAYTRMHNTWRVELENGSEECYGDVDLDQNREEKLLEPGGWYDVFLNSAYPELKCFTNARASIEQKLEIGVTRKKRRKEMSDEEASYFIHKNQKLIQEIDSDFKQLDTFYQHYIHQ
jgi:hypothetical protein